MAVEAKCTNCKHRGAKDICTEPRSPHHGRSVKPTDSCEYFLENPAEEHFAQGLAAGLADEQFPIAIVELEKAIALGLPQDGEMQAHYFLGAAYRKAAWHAGLPFAQLVRTAEFTRAFSEQETAVRMDRAGGFGYFAQPIGRALLPSFDLLCVLQSRVRTCSTSAPQPSR